MEPQEYTIGEFSLIVRMTVKTLRFYHEKEVLLPARVDPASGYRYYDAASVERARIITALRAMQFSLDDIREIVTECDDDEAAAGFLRRKATEINARIADLQRAARDVNRILAAVELLNQTGGPMNATLKTVEATEAVTIRYQGRYDAVGPRIGLMFRLCGRYVRGAVFSLYWNGEYRDDDADVEVCIGLKPKASEQARRAIERWLKRPLAAADDGSWTAQTESGDRIAVRTIAAAQVLAIVHVGGYDTIGTGYRALQDEVQNRGVRTTLPSREVYVKGPGMLFRGNPAKYRTEIQLPVV